MTTKVDAYYEDDVLRMLMPQGSEALVAKPSLKVYVAGPLNSSGKVADNIRNAVQAGLTLRRFGELPFVPHLYWYIETMTPESEEFWMSLDLAWLEQCDVVLRLPGVSVGSDQEVARATKLGMPVLFGLNAFFKWRQTLELAAEAYKEQREATQAAADAATLLPMNLAEEREKDLLTKQRLLKERGFSIDTVFWEFSQASDGGKNHDVEKQMRDFAGRGSVARGPVPPRYGEVMILIQQCLDFTPRLAINAEALTEWKPQGGVVLMWGPFEHQKIQFGEGKYGDVRDELRSLLFKLKKEAG